MLRARLHPCDSSFDSRFCDGTYTRQAGRKERCALTTAGIGYWDLLPDLFHWPAHEDMLPCPFGISYQLGRTALAAAWREGRLSTDRAHVLVIYDERNPAFAPAGLADRQWQVASKASRIPGYLRRVSWQALAGHLAAYPDLGWLVQALERKYGIVPHPPPP